MKKCPYCGAEHPDDAIVCAIDQTPFEEAAPQMSKDLRRISASPLGLAIKAGFAAFLINTGIYFAVGRAYLKIFNVLHPNDVVPSYVRQIITTSTPMRWILMTVFFAFTFAVCLKHCRKRWQAIAVATVTFSITALPLLSHVMLPVLVVPAFLIGVITNSSAGYFLGSALQICAGAWLLKAAEMGRGGLGGAAKGRP